MRSPQRRVKPTPVFYTIHHSVIFLILVFSGKAFALEKVAPKFDELSTIEIAADKTLSDVSVTSEGVGRTVNRLNDKFIESLQPTKLEQITSYLPNIQSARLGAGISDDFIVRGFALGGRLLLDGQLDNQSYYVRDPATIAGIEVVKGHDSVLYGAGAPGGSVNVIAKKPQNTPSQTLTLGLGSHLNKRLIFDSTGPVNKDINYRSILAAQAGDTWKENVTNKTVTLLNSLEWQYAKNSKLLTTWEYSNQGFPYDFDNVYANGKPVYDVSYVHPKTEAERQYHRISLDWQHTLNQDTWVEAKLNGIRGGRDEKQIGFFYLISDERPLVGYYREVDEQFAQSNVRLALHKAYDFMHVNNDLVLGYEYNTTDADFTNQRAFGTFSLDIYQPDFNVALPADNQLQLRDGYIDWRERAWFVQNTMHISPQLEWRIGARKSHFLLDYQRNNFVVSETDETALSKSVGLSWHVSPNLELYTSFSDSFLPNSGTDENGAFFEPMEGRQAEVGLQFANSKTQTNLNITLFDIKQTNVLTTNMTNPAYKSLAGEKHVRGGELALKQRINSQFGLQLSAGILAPKISENNDGYKGNDFPSVPKETASLILDYRYLPSFQGFVGVVYQGERAGDLANSFYVKSFTRLDASINGQINKTNQVTLSVQNVADKNYVSYATAQDFVRFGNPRTWMLTWQTQL